MEIDGHNAKVILVDEQGFLFAPVIEDRQREGRKGGDNRFLSCLQGLLGLPSAISRGVRTAVPFVEHGSPPERFEEGRTAGAVVAACGIAAIDGPFQRLPRWRRALDLLTHFLHRELSLAQADDILPGTSQQLLQHPVGRSGGFAMVKSDGGLIKIVIRPTRRAEVLQKSAVAESGQGQPSVLVIASRHLPHRDGTGVRVQIALDDAREQLRIVDGARCLQQIGGARTVSLSIRLAARLRHRRQQALRLGVNTDNSLRLALASPETSQRVRLAVEKVLQQAESAVPILIPDIVGRRLQAAWPRWRRSPGSTGRLLFSLCLRRDARNRVRAPAELTEQRRGPRAFDARASSMSSFLSRSIARWIGHGRNPCADEKMVGPCLRVDCRTNERSIPESSYRHGPPSRRCKVKVFPSSFPNLIGDLGTRRCPQRRGFLLYRFCR